MPWAVRLGLVGVERREGWQRGLTQLQAEDLRWGRASASLSSHLRLRGMGRASWLSMAPCRHRIFLRWVMVASCLVSLDGFVELWADREKKREARVLSAMHQSATLSDGLFWRLHWIYPWREIIRPTKTWRQPDHCSSSCCYRVSHSHTVLETEGNLLESAPERWNLGTGPSTGHENDVGHSPRHDTIGRYLSLSKIGVDCL